MHHDSHLLHRQLRGNYPLAAGAAGCWITDAAGKKYLDASGGAAVSCLGHAHPDVLAAMHAQIDRIAYAHTSFFSTEVAERLADALIAQRPRRHLARVSGVGRLRGGRGGAEARAPVLRREGRAAALALHRPPQQLSRQHARRAGGRRQRLAPPPVRAAADRRRARGADLRLPRPPRRRDRTSSTARGWRRNSRTRSSGSAARTSSRSSPRRSAAPPAAR